jgi:TatD DNase family protein
VSDTPDLPYLDAHAHIQSGRFDGDRAAMLARARAAGVGGIVCAADEIAGSRAALALAESDPLIWSTAGIHPHEAASAPAGWREALTELLAEPRCVALGEIGLDYFYDRSPRQTQRALFEQQLALLGTGGKPVVIHSRDAAEDTYAILGAWRATRRDDGPGLLHCYSYDADWAGRFLALGFYLSLPGTITYPNAEQTRAVARMVPLDRLTGETDCPYLAPQRWRGKRNEPAYLTETVREIAAQRGCDTLPLAIATAENARRLYKLDAAGVDAAPRGTP